MKKNLFIFLLVIVLISIFNLQKEELVIPNNSIRLRIIPSSNSPIDIYIKEQVKENIETNLLHKLSNVNNIEESRQIIKKVIPNIKENIDEIFLENNYNEAYKINFGNNYFPEKIYKGKVYDEGYYESLVVTIGSGSGDNFWCVLFPNFCLIDLEEDTEYKSYIYNLIKKLF